MNNSQKIADIEQVIANCKKNINEILEKAKLHKEKIEKYEAKIQKLEQEKKSLEAENITKK